MMREINTVLTEVFKANLGYVINIGKIVRWFYLFTSIILAFYL
tara:strand:+ start:391 stop:519 length:129 start_codon:yes stop_codon:yes gene_type:complete